MTNETKQLVWKLAKIGTIGTIVSIPFGVWAMRRWAGPSDAWKIAALLTAVSFVVKEALLRERRAA